MESQAVVLLTLDVMVVLCSLFLGYPLAGVLISGHAIYDGLSSHAVQNKVRHIQLCLWLVGKASCYTLTLMSMVILAFFFLAVFSFLWSCASHC